MSPSLPHPTKIQIIRRTSEKSNLNGGKISQYRQKSIKAAKYIAKIRKIKCPRKLPRHKTTKSAEKILTKVFTSFTLAVVSDEIARIVFKSVLMFLAIYRAKVKACRLSCDLIFIVFLLSSVMNRIYRCHIYPVITSTGYIGFNSSLKT